MKSQTETKVLKKDNNTSLFNKYQEYSKQNVMKDMK